MMSVRERIRNWLDVSAAVSAPGISSALAGKDFFAYCPPSGDGFCVDLKNYDNPANAYDDCSTLKAIVNRNALVMSGGRWWLTDAEGNDRLDAYPDLARLLVRPNPLQSWGELMITADVMRQLYGEVFFFAVRPEGFSNLDASALWVLSPAMVQVKQSGKLYRQAAIGDIVVSYELADGVAETLPSGQVLHVKDANVNLDFGRNDLRGRSRLRGLGNSIRNIIQAEEAVYSLNRDRGALGILSNESKDAAGLVAVTDEEKAAIQSAMMRRYGLSAGQSKIIVTDASLKWQPMTFSVADLKLFEGIEASVRRLCDAFNYPYELLATGEGVTYANKAEAKRGLYEDFIVPMAGIYATAFTRFFGLDARGDHFEVDFSHIACLKAAESDAAALFASKANALLSLYREGIISREEARLSLDYDEEVHGGTIVRIAVAEATEDNGGGGSRDQESAGGKDDE